MLIIVCPDISLQTAATLIHFPCSSCSSSSLVKLNSILNHMRTRVMKIGGLQRIQGERRQVDVGNGKGSWLL
jgi:hypothetical protein